jgi:hypothetical protein
MIKGTENLTIAEIQEELRKGAKFVVFQYAVSLLVVTFRQNTPIHFKRAGESTLSKSIAYSIITFVFGWWGIPWGPIYSIGALFNNFSGGKDVTADVLRAMNQPAPQQQYKAAAPQVQPATPPPGTFQTPQRQQPDRRMPGGTN